MVGLGGAALIMRSSTRAIALAIAGALVLAACGSTGATPTPAPVGSPSFAPDPSLATTPGASGSPAASVAASASPSSSAAPTDGIVGLNPDRTIPPGMPTWPPSVVNATIALAAVDNEFRKATLDFGAGAQSQDMELLLAAAEGMGFLADQSLPNAERLVNFSETEAVGMELVAAFTRVRAAATATVEALTSGDGAAAGAAMTELAGAMQAYGVARPGLIDRAELALVMRRGMLVK